MSKAPAMPMYWDAYLADTTHLTTEEHGAYLLLLAAMWRRNGVVPDDDRDNARILGLTPAKWRKVKARLLETISGFHIENGTITQEKLQKTWENTQEKIAKNRSNGAKGGRPKSNENRDLAKANGSFSVNPNESIPEPEPEPEEKKDTNVSSQKRAKRATAPEGFEDFWNTYPHRNGVKRGRQKAEQKFRTAVKSGMTPDALTEAASRYRQDRQVIDGYAKDPATWLNGKCWEDEIEHPDNVHAMRRKPEPGDRRTHPITGQTQYYINHADGWINEVC